MSDASSFFASYGQNAGYVQELYELYHRDRNTVPPAWASIFDKLDGRAEAPHTTNGNGYHHVTNGHAAAASPSVNPNVYERAFRLVRSYRDRGHLRAQVNPLSQGIVPLPQPAEVKPESYGFSSENLNVDVPCDNFQGKSSMPLGDLLTGLEQVYCGPIGAEFTHLLEPEARSFICERLEARVLKPELFPAAERQRILKSLVAAEVLEAELHRAYVGQKWFSGKGAETLIPMLQTLLDTAASAGVKEAVLGMAHRARLNVLVNIFGKPLGEVFNEFEDKTVFSLMGAGDAKYHLGYSSVYTASNNKPVRLSLVPNPSHLEFVNPVLEGISRARQDIGFNGDRNAVLPVLMHGDAAFVGQGVVPETLNLAALPGYTTGGTIHIVINNQVGFTTNPEEGRSSVYCTDLAKAFEAPVFHVNAEDPEASCWLMALAFEFRKKFQRDVIIDLYCYRVFGHNEGDEPSFTQPVLYAEIASKESIPSIYAGKLVEHGLISDEQYQALRKEASQNFKTAASNREPPPFGEACSVDGKIRGSEPKTAVPADVLQQVAKTIITYPEGFKPHPKLQKILEKRVETLTAGKGIDWGFAEALAFGSLLLEGSSVRITGQDVGRGTFSQRHLLLNNTERVSRYIPFEQLAKKGSARFDIANSSLSEAGVLGFEFGYGSVLDKGIVLWEAQFGDFVNGAQVYLDQFLASSEVKWGQRSGITLLLPHAFEGQASEHSSARLERFLQLCADGNMTVCYPSTAAQQFHLVRRQAFSAVKRPVIVMSPKSLLRHPGAACVINDLTKGSFKTVISDILGSGAKSEAIVLTSGKVYHDLAAAIEKEKSSQVQVLRVEQLYPFPEQELRSAVKGAKPKRVIWLQEEPENQGAWWYIRPRLKEVFGSEPIYAGRPASAAPATGSHHAHAHEQDALLKAALEAAAGR